MVDDESILVTAAQASLQLSRTAISFMAPVSIPPPNIPSLEQLATFQQLLVTLLAERR